MKELRIGLVLYGGVSLAIYMNGVVTELWNLLRASDGQAGGGERPANGTAAVYRDLLDDLQALRGSQPLRVVVDAVAGSSAGGLNGAALGKAIVEGGDVTVLSDIWLNQADIADLMVKPQRAPWWLPPVTAAATHIIGPLQGLPRLIDQQPGPDWRTTRNAAYRLVSAKGKAVPLDGSYFTRMIAQAFKGMAKKPGPRLMPERGTFDLFLTRSDLYGWPRHLPLNPEFHRDPVFEATYAHVMAFQHRPSGALIADDLDLTLRRARPRVSPEPSNRSVSPTSPGISKPKDPMTRRRLCRTLPGGIYASTCLQGTASTTPGWSTAACWTTSRSPTLRTLSNTSRPSTKCTGSSFTSSRTRP